VNEDVEKGKKEGKRQSMPSKKLWRMRVKSVEIAYSFGENKRERRTRKKRKTKLGRNWKMRGRRGGL
jgi:hypothetical protein